MVFNLHCFLVNIENKSPGIKSSHWKYDVESEIKSSDCQKPTGEVGKSWWLLFFFFFLKFELKRRFFCLFRRKKNIHTEHWRVYQQWKTSKYKLNVFFPIVSFTSDLSVYCLVKNVNLPQLSLTSGSCCHVSTGNKTKVKELCCVC